MNKKIIVIGGIVVVVIVALVVLFLVYGNSSGTGPGGTGGTTGTLPPASTSTPIAAAPTSTSITLGTGDGSVTMNNFYESPTATTTQDGKAVIIQDAGDYVITYNVPDSSFAIAIESTPLETARQEAESAFLSDLGISQQDACKLTVYEGVPIGVSEEYAGENFPLSFCGGPPTL